ncbi:MAG: hypothetical protein Q7S74_01265 [Nanoarchaeota archaeon]|nr:hypothetical protein [Nanoarchaeota archaeon]
MSKKILASQSSHLSSSGFYKAITLCEYAKGQNGCALSPEGRCAYDHDNSDCGLSKLLEQEKRIKSESQYSSPPERKRMRVESIYGPAQRKRAVQVESQHIPSIGKRTQAENQYSSAQRKSFQERYGMDWRQGIVV